MIDRVYIAASAHDGRFTRICVASVRWFYPEVAVRILPGGPLEPGLEEELARYWDVGVADLPRGDYGWGFVKLEPLFGSEGERFLVLDSDTVMAGLVLEPPASPAPFVVDDEQQTEADTRRLYYDWEKVARIDPQARPPAFVFNSGQWFGTAGVLKREDFAPLLDWGMPPRLKHPDLFMPGDQGVLNYVLNQKAALEGLPVLRRKLMVWPGHGMGEVTAAAVAARQAPPRIVHWAGMKKPRLAAMVSADVLAFFERQYYARLPGGALARAAGGLRHLGGEYGRRVRARLKGR